MNNFKYDIAFSFLSEDESLAYELNARLKDRVTTFLYSERERQAELAGRDGDEQLARVYGQEARTVVVLYRRGWGERGFTSAESTAIRDRAREFGYEFLTFVPLDEPRNVPVWLPKTRLWLDLKRVGLDTAAVVFESRVSEQGGEPREQSLEALAEQTVRQAREAEERWRFLNSSEVADRARAEYATVLAQVDRACKASAGLISGPIHEAGMFHMKAFGNRTTRFVLEPIPRNQFFSWELRVVEYVGAERERERPRNDTTQFHFDFGPSGDLGWREGTDHGKGDFFTSARLVDLFAKRMIRREQRKSDWVTF